LLFVSNQTQKEIGDDQLIIRGGIGKLELVLAFDQFPQSKTGKNDGDWLDTAHCRAGLNPDYILCHATDGASNVIGLAVAFQAITSAVRQTKIEHYICLAHQVNWSAKYASGMGDFSVNNNEQLSIVLQETHDINSRIYRNETCLKVLNSVQKQNKRLVSLQQFACICYLSCAFS
jgi:hypothetical protein